MVTIAVLLVILVVCFAAAVYRRGTCQQSWPDPDEQGSRMADDDIVPVRVVNYRDQ